MEKIVDTFSNRLTHALQIRNIKPIELAERSGVDRGKISSYMNGRYKAKQDTLYLIATVLKVSPVWLMGYDVPMEENSNILQKDLENKKVCSGNFSGKIPILGIVKAGYNYLAEENIIGYLAVDTSLNTEDFFALSVKGHSMENIIFEGDIAVVKKQNDFENGDIVVAIINGNEATIKKAYKTDNGLLLQPANASVEPLMFTKKEIEDIPVIIIGVVYNIIRKFK